jgi:hypothetical protein
MDLAIKFTGLPPYMALGSHMGEGQPSRNINASMEIMVFLKGICSRPTGKLNIPNSQAFMKLMRKRRISEPYSQFMAANSNTL